MTGSVAKWSSRRLLALLMCAVSQSLTQETVSVPHSPLGTAPPLPPGAPHPPPLYMRDNVNNYFGTAPDKGTLDGPVLGTPGVGHQNDTRHADFLSQASQSSSDDYWLSVLGSAGSMPFAPAGYQFFRNVKDFGAVGDGVTDDTAAINRAAATFGINNLNNFRCGKDCGSTTTLGAAVYFPPGTYLISNPIIQYYYTQFVGNPDSKPVIKGSSNFTGIALVDSDPYIPGGNGSEWYINQNNFYRQIRNFVFDMTGMNWTNTDGGQQYVPAGIHWQVGQATSITFCDFKMSVSQGSQAATAVGIYMENGSGGMVSDLTFTGGNIGFLAGSQQFSATNLQFTSCLTAIKQQWNWGFTWKNIYVLSCYVAIDCTAYSGVTSQGTGSIAVVDSHFNGVPYAITLADLGDEQPNIVLDNLLVENSQSVVLISGGKTLLEGSSSALYFDSWISGYQYLPDGSGGKSYGFARYVPTKPAALLDGSGAYFLRSRPQYAGVTPIVATEHGVSNDGTGDQTAAINSLLSSNIGSLIFFPGGVYLVEGTVQVPVGTLMTGSGWSQIMATGSYFQDIANPKVVVQVGKPGDKGIIEITDMLFTVKGPTAGAVLMEWNVHESTQGSAAMWDSHFRVGGADGTNLQLADCPIGSSEVRTSCMAAALVMHVTSQSSGYFENVWAWVADHDLDNPLNAFAFETSDGIPRDVQTQISVYSGRGILIESQGPTWFYGSASEHSQMYQYQLANASTIYLGHMQTETPYYQPSPNALSPYKAGGFPEDPTFANCADDLCRKAWALRIIESSDVFIYSAGFYSFFNGNQLGCASEEDCQLALIDTNFASGVWLYNIFTKGNVQIVSPQGGLDVLLFNSTTSDGYTSEIAAWLALAVGGADIGQDAGDGSGWVTIDPIIYSSGPTATVQCVPPCTYVMPPLTLASPTVFSFPPFTTTLEVGWTENAGLATTGTGPMPTYVTEIVTTVIQIPAVTTSIVPVFDVTVTNNNTVFLLTPSIQPPPFNITDNSVFSGTTHSAGTRTFYPPPWPYTLSLPAVTVTGPSGSSTTTSPGGILTSTSSLAPPSTTGGGITGGTNTRPPPTTVTFPVVSHTSGPPNPICTHVGGCGHHCKWICIDCWLLCPEISGFDWWDPNDPFDPFPPSLGPDPTNPDNPNPDNPDEPDDQCSTATYSSCSTSCITNAAASTQSCSSTCRNIIGCDTTGSYETVVSTITDGCTFRPPAPQTSFSMGAPVPIIGQGLYGDTIVYGSMDTSGMAPPVATVIPYEPSTTTPPPPATTTAPPPSTTTPTVISPVTSVPTPTDWAIQFFEYGACEPEGYLGTFDASIYDKCTPIGGTAATYIVYNPGDNHLCPVGTNELTEWTSFDMYQADSGVTAGCGSITDTVCVAQGCQTVQYQGEATYVDYVQVIKHTRAGGGIHNGTFLGDAVKRASNIGS